MRQKFSFLILVTALLVLFGNSVYSQETENKGAEGQVVEGFAPNFPTFAVATNTTGKIVVEVVVNDNGEVILSKQISGHPLFKT
jgi:hypothetical protein